MMLKNGLLNAMYAVAGEVGLCIEALTTAMRVNVHRRSTNSACCVDTF